MRWMMVHLWQGGRRGVVHVQGTRVVSRRCGSVLMEWGVMTPMVCPILMAAILSISPVDVPVRVMLVTC